MASFASRLDEAAASVTYEFQLRDVVLRWVEQGSLPPPQGECIANVLGYMLTTIDDEEQREANQGPFAPMYGFAHGQQWPPPPATISASCLEFVAETASLTRDPMVVARLSDFLWERRFGDAAHQHARSAITGYLTFGARPLSEFHDLTRVQMADRALELAMRLNDTGLTEKSRDELLSVASQSIEAATPGLGVVGRAARALLRLPEHLIPEGLSTLLERAHEVFGQDPSAAEAIYDLQIRLAGSDPQRRAALQGEQVAALVRAAEDAPHKFLRHAYLERARALLHQQNASSELQQRIALMVEQVPMDDEDFATVSAEVEIDGGHIRRLLVPATFPPSKVLYTRSGLPILHAVTEEQRIRYAIAQNELLAVGFWGQL